MTRWNYKINLIFSRCLLKHWCFLRFPSEMVAVDVSGRSFSRMSHLRRSMVHGEHEVTRRRTRPRRARGKRRNTIAGTDTKELAAIVGWVESQPTEGNSDYGNGDQGRSWKIQLRLPQFHNTRTIQLQWAGHLLFCNYIFEINEIASNLCIQSRNNLFL